MSLFQNFTGTMQTDFLIGGPSGIMLRKVSGGFEVRDSSGSALATLKTADLDVTGNIAVSGLVDTVDVAGLKSDFDTHDGTTSGNPHAVTKTEVGLSNVTDDAQVKKIDSAVDNSIATFDGTSGALIQDSLPTVDDSGSINIPAGQTYKIAGTSLSSADVGLGNVDNTSDANKPVSTPQQTALDLKADDADVIKKDGSVDFTSDQAMGGSKLTGLGLCTLDGDAARKSYVDSVASGLDVKASVRLATDAVLPNCTASGGPGVGKILTADAVGALSVDGIATALNDRILVKNQSTGADNGIYKVTTLGVDGSVAFVLTRATDADQDAEVTAGLFTFVSEGSTNLDKGFVLTTNDPITVDTTSLAFSQFSGAGQIEAGVGLAKSGDTLSVNVDDSTIEINGDTLRVPAGGITANELATDAVETAKIKNLNVTNAKLASNAVTTAKITDGNVTTDKLDSKAVTNGKIGDGAVDTLQLAADAVETAKILNANVTDAKLATGINATKIADGSVSNTEFQHISTVTSNVQDQLNALAPDTGTSKFIKVPVAWITTESTASIPSGAVVKNVYTKIKTAYDGSGAKTIQVIVDGTVDLEIQATNENSPTVVNTYKSEPILDVAADNTGKVKVVLPAGINQGAADVIVEYVGTFIS